MVPPDRFPTPDLRRRIRIVTATALIFAVVGVLRGLLMLVAGSPAGAAVLGLAAVTGLSITMLNRRGSSIQLTGNLVVGALVATCVAISIARGGVGTPVTAGAAIAILLAVLACGVRVALIWLAAVITLISMDASLQLRGLGFEDQVAQDKQFILDLSATIVIPSVIFFVGVAFEWTKSAALREQIAAEGDRQRAEHLAILAESERLAALGTLTAGIGHEINNPLTYVLGNLQLLQMELESSREQRIMVDETLSGVQQIRDVVREMMTYVRSDTEEHLQPVDVAQTLQTAIVLSQSHLKRVHAFTFDQQPVPPVVGSPHRLSQVWINLLVNACQATSQNVDEAGDVRVRLFTEDSLVCVEVEDNGVGIPAEIQSRIFDPFFSTKGPGQGTGLGLSVSARIVEDMEGTLSLRSLAGRTVFRVALPICAESTLAPPPKLRSLSQPVRVLIVDDDMRIGRVFSNLLAPHHEVVAVDSGTSALSRLREDSAWDVIVSDVMMPGINGAELLDVLQEESEPLCTIPIIFMTGGITDAKLRLRVIESSRPILSKPVSPELLEDAIARVLTT